MTEYDFVYKKKNKQKRKAVDSVVKFCGYLFVYKQVEGCLYNNTQC